MGPAWLRRWSNRGMVFGTAAVLTVVGAWIAHSLPQRNPFPQTHSVKRDLTHKSAQPLTTKVLTASTDGGTMRVTFHGRRMLTDVPHRRGHHERWNAIVVGRPERLTYERVRGYDGTMYLFRPVDASTHPVPVVVYFHGGSLMTGDAVIHPGPKYRKEWVMAEIERSLVQRGFAFVSVNYRLAPKYKWPDQIDDATASIRFLKANAAKLGINPLAVSVVGDSAGGALASLVGVTLSLIHI